MPDFDNDSLSGATFEDSVRQVARYLFSGAQSTGPIIIDGRERDEVINTGTEIIIFGATKHRKVDKTKYDLEKSRDLVRYLKGVNKFSEFNFRIILVTRDTPTADQAEYVRGAKTGCPKEIMSFNDLFSKLFDGRHYIRLRGDHLFGSVRNPADDTDFNVPASSYIPTSLSNSESGDSIKAEQIAEQSRSGGRFIIFGDYGSGKSMTLRDIYFRARDAFTRGATTKCPVYLNLREHIAQTAPDEALYRHATKIGYPNAQSLISAWRAGFVTLFLDGFDELTPPQFAVSVNGLKQSRRLAVEIVRKFFEETPNSAGVFFSGTRELF